jgi:predicted small lipoprotein YifL
MRSSSFRALAAALLLAAAPAAAGCGRGGSREAPGASGKAPPVEAHGTVTTSTRNTTRLGGADAISDAAAVARLAYPALTPATRPAAVVLVDLHAWPAALAAASLASTRLSAPVLYSEGDSLPALSAQTLEALHPRGSAALAGTQVIEIGVRVALPGSYVTRSLPAAQPAAAAAAAVEGLLREAGGGRPPRQAIVLAAEAPRALQMPAAGLAAESGAPIVFVEAHGIPLATAAALRAMHRPSIYVVCSSAIAAPTLKQLAAYGRVTQVTSGRGGAVSEAIEVARFTDGVFGWGVKEPGHGLVFANAGRPLDAPAAALLSATADFGPLLLLESSGPLPAALASYLSDIQPAYAPTPQLGPVRGVYNRGWLIGDESAISASTQAEIDALLQISPRKPSPEEAAISQSE